MKMTDNLFRVGRPLRPLARFDNPALRGVSVLQPALRVRDCDHGAWVLMAWRKGYKVPHYLTPDGSLWTNGLDDQQWLHESFAVFSSRDAAKQKGDAMRWGKGWDYLQLAQVQVSDGDALLVPVRESGDHSS